MSPCRLSHQIPEAGLAGGSDFIDQMLSLTVPSQVPSRWIRLEVGKKVYA